MCCVTLATGWESLVTIETKTGHFPFNICFISSQVNFLIAQVVELWSRTVVLIGGEARFFFRERDAHPSFRPTRWFPVKLWVWTIQTSYAISSLRPPRKVPSIQFYIMPPQNSRIPLVQIELIIPAKNIPSDNKIICLVCPNHCSHNWLASPSI